MESVWIARRQLREQRKREREQALRVRTLREDEAQRGKVRRNSEDALRVRDDVLDRRERALMRLRRSTNGSDSSAQDSGTLVKSPTLQER